MNISTDRGSTIPLIFGFFVIALLMVAAAISVGESFVQQHDLQAVCDGAAVAAAATAADLARGSDLASGRSLEFADVRSALDAYLARDPERVRVRVTALLSPDRTRIMLTCRETTSVAFGPLFGLRHLHHTARSAARAALVN